MEKAMRTALLLALLAALCLGLSGCENEDECIRQALIDMGYMSPTPAPSETPEASASPEPSETPEASGSPDSGILPKPGETPDIGSLPKPGETPDIGNLPKPGETLDDSGMSVPEGSVLPTPNLPTPNVPTPDVPTPNLPTLDVPAPNLPTPNLPDPAEVLPSLGDHLPRPYQDNASSALPGTPDAADDAPTP